MRGKLVKLMRREAFGKGNTAQRDRGYRWLEIPWTKKREAKITFLEKLRTWFGVDRPGVSLTLLADPKRQSYQGMKRYFKGLDWRTKTRIVRAST